MGGLVLSELTKIRSTRLWWALLIGAVLYVSVSALATAAFAGTDPGGGQPASPGLETDEAIRNIYVQSMFAGTYIFALILGITGMTGEYRYQTITPTFLVTPKRARVVLAKMIAHLGVGAVFAVVGLVTAVVVGAIVITIRGASLGFDADRLFPTMGLGIVAVALWTLLGIGLGTLMKNQIAAILTAVFITFLVEPLATFILAAQDLDAWVKWLPTNASSALMSPGDSFLDYLDWWAGGLVLLGYAAVLAGLGVVLSVRRDIS